ncbi:MAG: hypothetical protein DRI32_06015, partial [Chloroflexi bacterium]
MNPIKDGNNLLQAWRKANIASEEQIKQAGDLLDDSKTFVMVWAEEIAEIRNFGTKNDALTDFFAGAVYLMTGDEHSGYKDAICEKVDISKVQWNDRLKKLEKRAKLEQKENAKDDGEPIFHTGGWIGDHFLGLEYSPDLDRTFFAVRYPDGTVEDRVERVTIGHRKYVPIYANEIMRMKILLLPSEMNETVKSEEELLKMIRTHNYKYFDTGNDKMQEQLMTIYPLYTYMASQFRTIPYLRFLGDYGTGKTRALETIGPLCFQPIMTNAGSSASALMRILHMYQNSTLVLDEADFKDSSEASMIGKILNGGNRKGTGILKSSKDANGNFMPEAFMVVGPKIIGARKEFDDPATSSRCITKEMMPIQPHPRISPELPPLKTYARECLIIRNALFTYMMHNIQEDAEVSFDGIDPMVDARTKQITVSLLTIMKSKEGKSLVMDYMRTVTEERKSDRYSTFTARILEGLILAWAWGAVATRPEDAKRVYMKDIALASNLVLDEQKKLMGDDDVDEQADFVFGKKDEKSSSKKIKSQKVGHVFKKFLNISTVRATDGLPTYKGTMFVNMDVEEERIRGLCERWGVEWMERGSVEREKLPEYVD